MSTFENAMKEAGMIQPTDPEIIPKDKDWHMLIVKKEKKYFPMLGYYWNGGWTLGDTIPPQHVTVVKYDAAVRIKKHAGDPIQDDEGTMRLCETVLSKWHDSYANQLTSYYRMTEHERKMLRLHMEYEFPSWIVGEDMKKPAIDRMFREAQERKHV